MTQRRKTHYGYTERQAASGTKERLPAIDAFPNQYRGYEVRIEHPEFTCVCPKTGLPDFGCIVIEYVPDGLCLELKSLKYYLTSFRSVGIYQEHAANRVLEDLVAACRPRRMEVALDYRLRGGIHTLVTVRYP